MAHETRGERERAGRRERRRQRDRAAQSVPPEVVARIEATLDAAGLEGSDRDEVRLDLEDHFTVGLESGRPLAELLERFGSPDQVAPLLLAGHQELAERRTRGDGVRALPRRAAHELRVAARRLAARPAFSGAVVGTITVAVAAGTVILALVHTILLRPLPHPEPDRLVVVEHTAPGWGFPTLATISDGLYGAYRATGALQELGIYRAREANLLAGADPVRAEIVEATPSLLRVLGARPAAGRLLDDDEGRPDAPPVALLSHGLWVEAYGADAAAVGRTVVVNGLEHLIVGVLDEGFVFPGASPRVIAAHRLDEASAGTANMSLRAIGRLREDGTPEAVAAAFDAAIGPAVEARPGLNPAFVADGPLRTRIRTLADREVADTRGLLGVLAGAVALLALIAATNLATVYLVRGEHRSVELAVRSALGGGRFDLRATFLAEGLVVSVVGGGLGIVGGAVGLELVRRADLDLPRLSELGLAGVPLGGVVALTVALGLVAAFAPVLPGRHGLASILRSGAGQSRPGGWMTGVRGALVGLQVALALVLVVGAGLMLRTGLSLGRVDPGFDTDGLVVLDVPLSPASYPSATEAVAFHAELREALAALPGVRGAGLSTGLPVRDGPAGRALIVRAWAGVREIPGLITDTRFVRPGWLETVGIPVLEGRGLDASDARADGRAFVVSESLAAELWPGEPALGREVRFDGQDPDIWYTVVGVVGDTRDDGLREAPAATLYVPMGEEEARFGHEAHTLTYAVRTDLDVGSVAAAMRSLVRERDPSVPLTGAETADEILRASYARVSLTLLLLTIAAVASLFLAVVGIFGVVSYWVERRAREMGIRKALGAPAGAIEALVLRQGASLFAMGGAVGTVLAIAAGRSAESLLFGVGAFDPLTYGIALSAVLGAALVAVAIPARRASKADPVSTLRRE